ncbi:hypothetical protein FAI40_04145 [Acetobacteraceae bacterium]|nr:hypothetical protein FAI40_04145 [Acetobacteraceae bacterium]
MMEQRDTEIAQNILDYLNNTPIDKTRTANEIFQACGGGETIEALRMLEREGKVTRLNETDYRAN